MGWVCEDNPKHEGYLVGLVPIVGTGYKFRELGSDDKELAPPAGLKLHFVQVACDCGWRSSRFMPPFGTTWSPNSVFVPQQQRPSPFYPNGIDHPFETAAIALWRHHCRETEYDLGWDRLHIVATHDDLWCPCGGYLTMVEDSETGDKLCADCRRIFRPGVGFSAPNMTGKKLPTGGIITAVEDHYRLAPASEPPAKGNRR